jgi:hypothetical protein
VKRITVILAMLFVSTVTVLGQAGPGQENNLRGLKGVRLIVMFGRAEAIDEAERPAILKLVEADVSAKLKSAGITLLQLHNEIVDAGAPYLMVYVTCDKPNGYVYPVVTDVKLQQRVRLLRDPSIEADVATWREGGIGAGKLSPDLIRQLVSSSIDTFIRDYRIVNLSSARR